jgi:hypothetical protein
LRREEGYSMKSATIFIAFGLLAGIIQRIINILAGLETSKGLKGILHNFPTYALGVLVGYYVFEALNPCRPGRWSRSYYDVELHPGHAILARG